jgi:hypothetical protein
MLIESPPSLLKARMRRPRREGSAVGRSRVASSRIWIMLGCNGRGYSYLNRVLFFRLLMPSSERSFQFRHALHALSFT